jgi:hypothetical protein
MRLAAVLVLALPAVAFAQAPGMYDTSRPLAPPGMTPPDGDRDEPPGGPPAPVAQPEGLAAYAARDPAADRAFGTSTAVALPSGKVDISGRASFFGGVGSVAAGLGGGIEVSADVGAIADDVGSIGGGVKITVAHSRTVALAATASYHRMSDDCYDCSSDDGLWAVGGVVSTCIGETCSSLLSAGGGVMGVADDDDKIGYVTGSLVAGSGSFRPILEGAALLGDGGGVLGFAGARIGGKRVAFDAGIGFVVADDGGDGGAAGAPMIGLSIRP